VNLNTEQMTKTDRVITSNAPELFKQQVLFQIYSKKNPVTSSTRKSASRQTAWLC